MFKFICLIASVSAINLVKDVTHDPTPADLAALAKEEAGSQAHADKIEGIRTTDISAQAASDVWRA